MSVRRIPVLMTLFFISASVVAHSATGHAASPAAAGAEAQAAPAVKPTQAKPPQSRPSAATADPTPASAAFSCSFISATSRSINATACGVIETARQHKDRIGKVYAGRDGIIGALTEDLIDTSKESAAAVAALAERPA